MVKTCAPRQKLSWFPPCSTGTGSRIDLLQRAADKKSGDRSLSISCVGEWLPCGEFTQGRGLESIQQMTVMTYLDPRKTIWPGLISGLCLALALEATQQAQPVVVTSVVAWLCMIWWIFEPIPIPVTSLLPIAVFPVTGILTAEQVGASVGVTPDHLCCWVGFYSPEAWRVLAHIIVLR